MELLQLFSLTASFLCCIQRGVEWIAQNEDAATGFLQSLADQLLPFSTVAFPMLLIFLPLAIGWPARQRGICKKISEGLITAFKNVALMKPNRKIFCIIIGVDWQKPL